MKTELFLLTHFPCVFMSLSTLCLSVCVKHSSSAPAVCTRASYVYTYSCWVYSVRLGQGLACALFLVLLALSFPLSLLCSPCLPPSVSVYLWGCLCVRVVGVELLSPGYTTSLHTCTHQLSGISTPVLHPLITIDPRFDEHDVPQDPSTLPGNQSPRHPRSRAIIPTQLGFTSHLLSVILTSTHTHSLRAEGKLFSYSF